MNRWFSSILLAPFLSAMLTIPLTATAGSGPWTLSEGDLSVYVEGNHSQWQRAMGAVREGPGMEVGTRFMQTGAKAIASFGIINSIELESTVGWAHSTTSDASSGPCADFSCKTLNTLIPVQARLKVRLLDELNGLPLSLAIGMSARYGTFTAKDRHRITTIGEGSFDLGGFTSLGRSGAIGSIGYAMWMEGQYRHRIPAGQTASGNVPGDEILLSAEWSLLPKSWIALGVVIDYLHRIEGTSLMEMDPTQPDSIASLAAKSLKVGGKVSIRNSKNFAFSVAYLHTVYARNNPSDLFSLATGVTFYIPAKKVN